jgi:hypothetical protein
MSENSANDTPQQPSFDAVAYAAAAANADRALHAFVETAVVGRAEGVVRSARLADLAAEQKSAFRRASAARGRLTRARKDGSADAIAAAAQRLREAEAEADRVSRATVAEGFGLVNAGQDHVGALLTQMGESWQAEDETLAALGMKRERP